MYCLEFWWPGHNHLPYLKYIKFKKFFQRDQKMAKLLVEHCGNIKGVIGMWLFQVKLNLFCKKTMVKWRLPNAKRSWEETTKSLEFHSLTDLSFFMAFRVACQLTSRLTSISSVGLSFISCAKITGNFGGGLLSLKFLTLRHCFFSAKNCLVIPTDFYTMKCMILQVLGIKFRWNSPSLRIL